VKHTVQYISEGVQTTIRLEELVDYLASKDAAVGKFIDRQKHVPKAVPVDAVAVETPKGKKKSDK